MKKIRVKKKDLYAALAYQDNTEFIFVEGEEVEERKTLEDSILKKDRLLEIFTSDLEKFCVDYGQEELAKAIRAEGFIHKDEIEWPKELTDEFPGDKDNSYYQKAKWTWNECLMACKQSVERAR